MPGHAQLFEGMQSAALDEVYKQMRPLHFDPHAVICREGEPGGSLFLIERGLAQVLIGNEVPVGRLRRGEVIGEMSLIAATPRSATVVALVPTDVLELRQDAFGALVAHHPTILVNLGRVLSDRLARQNRFSLKQSRGEAVVLVTNDRLRALVDEMVAATKTASPRSVAVQDLGTSVSGGPGASPSTEGILAILDDLLGAHGTAVVLASTEQEDLPLILEHMDRIVVVAEATDRLTGRLGPAAGRAELVLVGGERHGGPQTVQGLKVVRAIDRNESRRDVAWVGRHLARTKLGLALGAGGAKGYAHLAVLQVLEEAGYTVDYVAGSSIGALVGAWLAQGMNAAEMDATMRGAFTPERVAAMFKLSLAGTSTGLDVHTQVCKETTRERSFADLDIPLLAMAVDLDSREPVVLREGPVWQALLASTALAGMFPPQVSSGRRLVDGLALVPVPVGAVADAGADVTVSVNLIGKETLPTWPGEPPPPPPRARKGSRMLDTLLEVMDVAQMDSSVRHAALADVVITPRFGPSTWRDFHLAQQFFAAGRAAAEQQLPSLRALASPQGT